MVKSSRNTNIRNRHPQKIMNRAVESVKINKTKQAEQIYDASEYAKSDIKWSAVSAGIVLLALVILYILFR